MSLAIVLIKHHGDIHSGYDALCKLVLSADFFDKTRTIVESAAFVFGAADYAIVVYAGSWGDIGSAITVIGETLAAAPSANGIRPLTSTILGTDARNNPAFAAVNELIREARDAQAPTGNFVDPDIIAQQVLCRRYFRERLQRLIEIAEVTGNLRVWSNRSSALKEVSDLAEKLAARLISLKELDT